MTTELDLAIVGGRVVTPGGVRRAAIGIRDGRIVAIAEDPLLPAAKERIDVRGQYVLPGVVDPEGHLGTQRDLPADLVSETKAAASAGVTTWGFQTSSPVLRPTFKAAPTPEDVVPFSKAMPILLELSKDRWWVDFWVTAMVTTDEQCDEIDRLASEFGITSFKLMLHTMSGERRFGDWSLQRQNGLYGFDDGVVYLTFEKAANLGPPAIVSIHPENWEIARLFKDRLIAQGRTDTRAWAEHSPAFLEAGHVRAYAYYAGIAGCPLYIQHTSTPETIDEIRAARREGVKVVAQTAPHYLTLPSETARVNVPLRDASVFPALWRALADGTLNTIGSDHVSRGLSRAEMDKGSVWRSISGFPSRVEMALPLMLSEGVNAGRITIERLVEVCCEAPARAFGVYPRKGALEVGSDADVVVVDLDRRATVRDENVYTASAWSVISGRELKGWPTMTILRGRVIARWNEERQRNEVVGPPIGEYVRRVPGHVLYPIEPASADKIAAGIPV